MEEQKRRRSHGQSWQFRQVSRRRLRIHPFSLQRTVILFVAFSLVILPALGAKTSRVMAQAGGASDLMDTVNRLRSANGLAPYRVNDSLMAAAQSQSEYQAANGTVTHTGSGGSQPRGRAAAFGYGGGGSIYVSENIASGNGMSPQQAVQIWQGDSLHLNTMLSASARDAGAGAARAGDQVYYTLVTGYVAGEAGSGTGNTSAQPAATPTATSAARPDTPAPTTGFVVPVEVATPGPDGSIIHVVEPGQALWSIAATYKVNLDDLLAMNGLTNSPVIYPGNRLLIKPADRTPSVTAPETETTLTPASPTATPRPTRTPSPTATRTIAAATLVEAMATPTPSVQAFSTEEPGASRSDPLLVVIAVLVFTGTTLVIAGSALKRSA